MKGNKKRFIAFLLCGVLSLSTSAFYDVTAFASTNITTVKNENLPRKEVLVSGKAIGIAMNTDGVVITEVTSVSDLEGNKNFPAADAGLRAGDVIKKINGKDVESTVHLVELINKNENKTITVVYDRNGTIRSTKVEPKIDASAGEYKIGVLVRDGTSGIGTLTFVDPETNTFASLGHPITEPKTSLILPVKDGEIAFAKVTGIVKGKSGAPGELQGSFELDSRIGKIEKNNEFGLFGTIGNDEIKKDTIVMPIAFQSEIKVGDAEIISSLDGEKPERYKIKITRINSQNSKETKGMVIEVTDERLLAKTGGIVQGMSGSPIVQNGHLVGAVTHVTVNNPAKGYGIFIEWMLDESMQLAA